MNLSFIEERNSVDFPEFNNEKVYMHSFFQKDGLPQHLKHWQRTVDQMLDGIQTEKAMFLMIDQKHVQPGDPHRRPGLHIDGYWNPGEFLHKGTHIGTTASSHKSAPSHHSRSPSQPQERHNGQPMPQTHSGETPRRPRMSSDYSLEEKIELVRQGKAKWESQANGEIITGWINPDFSSPEATILASNYSAAKGYHGYWNEDPKFGGDCSHIHTSNLLEILMEANKVYAGNIAMLHESITINQPVNRTLVRLTVPGWSPELEHI